MLASNHWFNPLTCGEQFGYVTPPPFFINFRSRYPGMAAAHVTHTGQHVRFYRCQKYMDDAQEKLRVYLDTVRYQRDIAGENRMEFPRVMFQPSKLVPEKLVPVHVGDCEDIALAQKDVAGRAGIPPECMLFVLAMDRYRQEPHMLFCIVTSPTTSTMVDNVREGNFERLDFLAVEQPGMLSWAWCRKPTQGDRMLFDVDDDGRRWNRSVTLAELRHKIFGTEETFS